MSAKEVDNWWFKIGSGICKSNNDDIESHIEKIVKRYANDLEIFVLTREINEYNQDGEYFITLFYGKPTIDEIKKHTVDNDNYARHILEGGGRVECENQWWNLKKFEN